MIAIINWIRLLLYRLGIRPEFTTILNSLAPTLVHNNFRIAMPWGNQHPDLPYAIMDENSVGIHDMYMSLTVVRLSELNPPIFSTGVIHYPPPLFRGRFEIKFSLPLGDKSHPSFWLMGETWPPEIDIFEFMPGFDKRGRKILSTSVHYDADNKSKAKTHNIGKISPGEILTVSLLWTESKLIWYFNGIEIRRINNKKFLDKHFNQPMTLIIGTGCRANHVEESDRSRFSIYKVSYEKL